jgi:hypothetical protein
MRRARLSFSLRTSFVLVIVFAVYLGFAVNNASQQRKAVKAIEALGGVVRYNWQHVPDCGFHQANDLAIGEPSGPKWLRRLIGDDYFQNVEMANLAYLPPPTESEMFEEAQRIKCLRGLKELWLWPSVSNGTLERVRAELPGVTVRLYPPSP